MADSQSSLNKEELKVRLYTWQASGLVSAEQVAKILEFEQVDRTGTTVRWKWLKLLGILSLASAGVVLLKEFWDEIPRGVRLLGLILAVSITQAVGFKQLIARDGFGELLLLLAQILFGASIFLVDSMYDSLLELDRAMYIWSLSALGTAYFADSTKILLTSTLLICYWMMQKPDLLLFIPLGAVGIFASVKRSNFVGFISFVLLSYAAVFVEFWDVFSTASKSAIFVASFPIWHALSSLMSPSVIWQGVKQWSFWLMFPVSIYWLFPEVWHETFELPGGSHIYGQIYSCFGLWLAYKSRVKGWERVVIFCLILISVLISFLPMSNLSSYSSASPISGRAIFASLVALVVSIVIGTFSIFHGTSTRNILPVRIGCYYLLACFLAVIITRHLNHFTVAFFLSVAGILMIGLETWLKKKFSAQ